MDGEAFEITRLLAQKEGIFVGTSSGAAVAIALKLASCIDHGNIVVLLPDRCFAHYSAARFLPHPKAGTRTRNSLNS